MYNRRPEPVSSMSSASDENSATALPKRIAAAAASRAAADALGGEQRAAAVKIESVSRVVSLVKDKELSLFSVSRLASNATRRRNVSASKSLACARRDSVMYDVTSLASCSTMDGRSVGNVGGGDSFFTALDPSRLSNPGRTSSNPRSKFVIRSVSVSLSAFESSLYVRAAALAADARLSCTYTLSSHRAGTGFDVARLCFLSSAQLSKTSGGAKLSGVACNASSVLAAQSGAVSSGAQSTLHKSNSSVRISADSFKWSARSNPSTATLAAASKKAYATSEVSSESSRSEANRAGWRWNATSTACVVLRRRRKRGASMSVEVGGGAIQRIWAGCVSVRCSTALYLKTVPALTTALRVRG